MYQRGGAVDGQYVFSGIDHDNVLYVQYMNIHFCTCIYSGCLLDLVLCRQFRVGVKVV